MTLTLTLTLPEDDSANPVFEEKAQAPANIINARNVILVVLLFFFALPIAIFFQWANRVAYAWRPGGGNKKAHSALSVGADELLTLQHVNCYSIKSSFISFGDRAVSCETPSFAPPPRDGFAFFVLDCLSAFKSGIVNFDDFFFSFPGDRYNIMIKERNSGL
jgi:hypothetical protein